MEHLLIVMLACGILFATGFGFAQEFPRSTMGDKYWELWNDGVQKKIDESIEQHRKADGKVSLTGVKPASDVKVEQISHDFIFGANIFNFNQLGTTERNKRYKELFGTLFNSATIAFYWKKFEPQSGQPRFKASEKDREEFWNNSKDPKKEFHWRRPAADPVVEFCESKGIRLHGHPMIWGNRKWHHPEWLPQDPAQIAEMQKAFDKRIVELAEYYKGRLQSWDIVNESAVDYKGNTTTGEAVAKSSYGLMPGDYTYKSFKTAERVLPANVLMNINDYLNNENYANQVKELLQKGCKIDILGSQMHLFNPQQCLDVAEGKPIQAPNGVWGTMNTLAKAGLPIHLSEITITAPGDDERGRAIQAVIARNLYRLWFSIPQMMGITWWNIVDDCGAPGEPTTSGLFTRDMQPKPSYFALDQLINKEWKTSLTVKAEGETVDLAFRGFKGKYRITWTDKNDKVQTKEVHVK